MIDRICGFIHNYFTADSDIRAGTYTIENGGIALPFLDYGNYFRIVGSRMNDGVYQYPMSDLSDETFTGQIWAMRVPRAVREIAREAEALEEKYAEQLNSPFSSENIISVYGYTKAAGADGGGDAWLFGKNGVFGPRLNQWRKIG